MMTLHYSSLPQGRWLKTVEEAKAKRQAPAVLVLEVQHFACSREGNYTMGCHDCGVFWVQILGNNRVQSYFLPKMVAIRREEV
jgi:hypothetical protein